MQWALKPKRPFLKPNHISVQIFVSYFLYWCVIWQRETSHFRNSEWISSYHENSRAYRHYQPLINLTQRLHLFAAPFTQTTSCPPVNLTVGLSSINYIYISTIIIYVYHYISLITFLSLHFNHYISIITLPSLIFHQLHLPLSNRQHHVPLVLLINLTAFHQFQFYEDKKQ